MPGSALEFWLAANPDYPLARMARPAAETGDIVLTQAPGAPVAAAIENASVESDPLGRLSSAGRTSAASAAAKGASSAGPASTAAVRATAPGSMPDLNEHTLRDALFQLKDLGLDVEYSGSGRVIRQEPAPGARIKAGQKCILTLGWMG